MEDPSIIEELPCSHKISFDSQKEATTSATVAQHQHGTKLKAYRCKFCKLWHLASAYNE